MQIGQFIQQILRDPDNRNRITHTVSFPGTTAQYGDPERPLRPETVNMLASIGIEKLYSHQAAAVNQIMDGSDVIIVTSTASGKSLCYTIPLIESILSDSCSRSFLFFPTKALAHDQLKFLTSCSNHVSAAGDILRPFTYDGDTPPHKKKAIREKANVILSNPDMLHAGILSHHAKWAEFFMNLRYIVIDEIHSYKGAFGSHVGNVFRRLNRICAYYHANPLYICCSATIANPAGHALNITGKKVSIINNDGSPRGRRTFIFHNPPIVDHTLMIRKSPHKEAVSYLRQAVSNNFQSIAFLRSRSSAELLYRTLFENLRRQRNGSEKRVEPYRSGYLPAERRKIEDRLRKKDILAVLTTNALELGIDIGSLDFSLIIGYPGSVSSFMQQAGRSGRKQGESLVIFIAQNDPVDQYTIRTAEIFLKKNTEKIVTNPENPFILAYHLSCAAFELPLSQSDSAFFGRLTNDVSFLLEETGYLKNINGRLFWKKSDYPHSKSSLRTISDDRFTILCREPEITVIGEVDSFSAPYFLYPGGVYLHKDRSYIVESFNQEEKSAFVKEADPGYYTMPVAVSNVTETEIIEKEENYRIHSALSNLDVRSQVTGYKKVKLHSKEQLGQVSVDMPPFTLKTNGLSIIFERELMAEIEISEYQFHEGLLGIKNLFATALTVIAQCDKTDIGSSLHVSIDGRPVIYLYDMYQGGLGYCEFGFRNIGILLSTAELLIDECECADGCPSCTGARESVPSFSASNPLAGMMPEKMSAGKILKTVSARYPHVD